MNEYITKGDYYVYRSVKLVKDNVYQITAIPTHLAQVGQKLQIRPNKKSEWSSGWIVDQVYQEKLIDSRNCEDEDIIWECW